MKHWLGIIAAVFALPAWSQANLLTNGSFESGLFLPPSNETYSLPVASTDITGWTLVVDAVTWMNAGNPWGLSASNGSKFLDLTDSQVGAPFGGVQQTIATTIGQPYQLSFAVGSSQNYGNPTGVLATAGSVSQTFTTSVSGNNQWTVFSLNFTATAANTVIRLEGSAGQNYTGLDNVSVIATSVPEPPWYILAGSGLAVMALVSRRRRSDRSND